MAWTLTGNIRGPAGPTGATGATGPAGAAGPGGLTWRGAWSSTTAYAVNDSVSSNGSTFFAVAASTNEQPSQAYPPVATASWAVLAIEGAQGPTGPTGPQGAPGTAGATGSTGPAGTAGTAGTTGATGGTGTRGSLWTTGSDAPGTITGAQTNDQFLDGVTGNVYTYS